MKRIRRCRWSAPTCPTSWQMFRRCITTLSARARTIDGGSRVRFSYSKTRGSSIRANPVFVAIWPWADTATARIYVSSSTKSDRILDALPYNVKWKLKSCATRWIARYVGSMSDKDMFVTGRRHVICRKRARRLSKRRRVKRILSNGWRNSLAKYKVMRRNWRFTSEDPRQ